MPDITQHKPLVLWLKKARRLVLERQDITLLLTDAYSSAANLEAIVVTDVVHGYSDKRPTTILAVEMLDDSHSIPRIIKVGPMTELSPEIDGWNEMVNRGLIEPPDRFFMNLQNKVVSKADTLVLEYQYGEDFLRGCDEVISLEDAVNRCCRGDNPASVELQRAVKTIIDDVSNALYYRGVELNTDKVKAHFGQRLGPFLGKWNDERYLQLRKRLSPALADPSIFLDPIHFLSVWLDPACGAPFPSCLFGPCHGDLHGRNIRIGLKDEEVHGAVAFDYEKMSLMRPIAREFVKLETELKVRLLDTVVRERIKDGNYRFPIIEFEKELNQATLRLDGTPFSSPKEFPNAARRLFEILLKIRDCARKVLGQSRPNDTWFAEYALTTAAYTVRAAKYEAYKDRMLEIAYIAGGSALAHLQKTSYAVT